jgi:uncharacterized protein (TIGR02266 family)
VSIAPRSYRRGGDRIEAEIEIGFASDSNFYTGFSENISEGGVFVATFREHRLGDRIDVSFTLPGDDHPLRLHAEVRWIRSQDPHDESPPGYGLQFVDLPDDARVQIERFIKMRDPLFYE